jgi:hypothetical protein
MKGWGLLRLRLEVLELSVPRYDTGVEARRVHET